MTKTAALALCSALAFDPSSDGSAPEWVHLLPAGGSVATVDGRGPYTVSDYNALMADSLPAGGKLVLDENHSTDLAAPKGFPAPARGWIVELQQRDDGIWGRVDWTDEGRKLAGAYRGISPVIAHRKDKSIVAIRRASLVNQPNLEGLTALHSEDSGMDFKKKLLELLKLDENATDESIVEALNAALADDDGELETALQSVLTPIAEALGLGQGADVAAIVAAIGKLKKPVMATHAVQSDVVTALQSELADVTTQLNAMQESAARKEAESFVDGAIAEGRVGVKPMRDEYIAMHMEDPERVKKLIGAMPAINGRTTSSRTEIKRSTDLDEADRSVIALMGLDPEEFKKTRAAEAGQTEEAL